MPARGGAASAQPRECDQPITEPRRSDGGTRGETPRSGVGLFAAQMPGIPSRADFRHPYGVPSLICLCSRGCAEAAPPRAGRGASLRAMAVNLASNPHFYRCFAL